MQNEITPAQVKIMIGSSAINQEFSNKIKELNRRLAMNGMKYSQWDTLTDREHDVFSHDMFLDGQCARSVEDYVTVAADSCGCADVDEDLYHHSPALMSELEKHRSIPGGVDPYIAEARTKLGSSVDPIIDEVLVDLLS
jgi:hypothetical protein